MMKRSMRALLVVAVLLVGAAALLVARTGDVFRGDTSVSAVREIRLVVRDMTFYVEGQKEPNPTLHAKAGERLRIVLSNTDSGMSHDFTIRSWRVGTRLLKGKGQDAVEFTAPANGGSQAYSCTPHAEMMGGTIVVD
jgi:plastocyanin